MIKILVVDDDSAFREVIVDAIEGIFSGAEVVQAANGLEARDKFMENHFDLLVTDYEMPNMSGLGLLKFIKNSAKSVSAVMISGLQDSQQLEDSVEGLGFKFLKKPFHLKELEQILSGFENLGIGK